MRSSTVGARLRLADAERSAKRRSGWALWRAMSSYTRTTMRTPTKIAMPIVMAFRAPGLGAEELQLIQRESEAVRRTKHGPNPQRQAPFRGAEAVNAINDLRDRSTTSRINR